MPDANDTALPSHGPIHCRACWGASTESAFTTSDGAFRVVNDPGAWGAANPEVLILGISKGFTQANEFSRGNFDAVPFKNCRSRVRQSLSAIGLMDESLDIDAAMSATETRLGWGSLVRCSLSGWNSKRRAFGAGSPDVLPAFVHLEAQRFLKGCMNRFLKNLPVRTRIVALFGNDDRYISTVGAELRTLFGASYSMTNPVAHRTSNVLWVHTAHPSPGNGHFSAFLTGPSTAKQGHKRDLARHAVLKHLHS